MSMSKRLTRSEYLVPYMIIITLACFIGGFFLGAGVMKARIQNELEATAKAEEAAKEREQMLKAQKLYRDQDFIRYYYSVSVHMNELKKKHFETSATLFDSAKSEQKDMLKELRALARAKEKELDATTIPSTSPLLVEAKQAYLGSMKFYQAGIDQLISQLSTGAVSADDLASMRIQPDFVNAWNQAQASEYKALAMWETVYITKQPLQQVQPSLVSLTQWKAYPFHYRNYLSALSISQSKRFHEFSPADLTSRIDNVLQSGSATSFGWKDIGQAARILEATDAVRKDDFLAMRTRLYPDLAAPEIPLFSK